jgi:alkanesulfonate monooxygenase SsuD/methylene tetrahydromethanopterin reductase-like flavin-dependent oxidoreductase (luciferase family)
VAQAWASFDLLAPERPFLGVGAGENLNEGAAGGGWSRYPGRASRLIESIEIIRELWNGNHVKIKGQYWNLNAKLYDPPVSRIPLYVAAGGMNSALIAGRYGDGLITGAGDLKKNTELLKAWNAGVREKGKDPRSQVLMVEHWAIIGNERDAREAARKWRFVPKAWEPGFFDNISPAKIHERAEKEIHLQQVYQDWPVSTDPEVHVEAIRELAALGATHVVVHVPTPNQRNVIDFFGREVLPVV